MFIFAIQQPWKPLAVMNIGGSTGVAAYKAMLSIDADAVFETVVIDAIHCNPVTVYVLMQQSMWVRIPTTL
jgi:uncharacterized membrane protein